MRHRLPVCTILIALLVPCWPWQPAHAIDTLSDSEQAEAAVPPALFVIGVPATLQQSVHRAVGERFGSEALTDSVRADDAQALERAAATGAQQVIALGRDACAAVIAARFARPVLCALLYADAFDALDCGAGCDNVEAIVLDQPPERQARVATSLFPALERFGVLRDGLFASTLPGIVSRTFDPQRRLSAQLTELLLSVDAVIVEPRARLYPPSSLRTVLLTAYGRDRPIVGYGRDWVRAGALVSAWSTPRDVLGDVRDVLRERGHGGAPVTMRIHPPHRFHVVDNPAIARSLGLRRRPLDTENRPFVDEDFRR